MKYLFACLLLAQTAFADGLKWEATMHHIEVRPGEQEIRTQFPYRNAGKTPVRIESVRGVCVCCTAAYATKKKLAPGESGAVVVRVDFEKKPLPLVKPVTVKTDDGRTTVLVVEVFAKP
jgi:molybdenum cofactor biosynthesis enzyme